MSEFMSFAQHGASSTKVGDREAAAIGQANAQGERQRAWGHIVRAGVDPNGRQMTIGTNLGSSHTINLEHVYWYDTLDNAGDILLGWSITPLGDAIVWDRLGVELPLFAFQNGYYGPRKWLEAKFGPAPEPLS